MYRQYRRKFVDEHTRKNVLHGDFDQVLPRESKTVRIFTSSTFTDTEHERNALMENVYPELKKHCREKGYEFQVVDMRWGIREEAANDHSTTDLCLKELADCKALSTGPYFVTFLSHKYGKRPLRRLIPKHEFHILLQHITDENDRKLLLRWYETDHNSRNPTFVLRKITDNIPDYGKKSGRSQWAQESEALARIILEAARHEESIYDKYAMSVTEAEISNAIDTSKQNRCCFWFHRIIDDIDQQDPKNKLLSRYKEMSEHAGMGPEHTHSRIEAVKLKLREAIPRSNICDHHAVWKDIPASKEKHTLAYKMYIKKFCETFKDTIKKSIAEGSKDIPQPYVSDSLCQEVMQHINFCKEKCQLFHGRRKVIEKIKAVVTEKKSVRFVIYGESGSGKTSLTAQTAIAIKSWLSNEQVEKPVLVLRFIGTTPNSSSLRQLLISVVTQIDEAYRVGGFDPIQHADKTVDRNLSVEKLKKRFADLLMKACEKRPLILILDALDQLSNDDNPHDLSWIPSSLPNHVYFIVSTLQEPQYHYFQNLQKQFTDTECNFYKVPPIEYSEAKQIMESWLEGVNRTVTSEQKKQIEDSIRKCQLPLFLKLCFDEARKWTSFYKVEELQDTIQKAIASMFTNMEKKHGDRLTSHAFAYITASRYGLSEIELEDILSCDDEVLEDVCEYWTPTIIRLPPLLLVRLKADVSQYLVQRGSEGTTVIFWYHRQFIEAANERYLTDETKTLIHSNIADYFLGRWTNVAKPYKGQHKERYVTPQPTSVSNLRKLAELTYQLISANMYQQLNDHVIMSLQWHLARIKAFSYRDLMNDIINSIEHMSTAGYDCSDWVLLKGILNLSEDALIHTADLLPSQVLGRAQHLNLKTDKGLGKFLEECRMETGYRLRVTTPSLTAPGGELLFCLTGHTWQASHARITKDDQFAVTGSTEGSVRVWDLNKGTEVTVINTLGKGQRDRHIKQLFLCCQDAFIVLVFRSRIVIIDLRSGKIHKYCDVKRDYGGTVCTLFDAQTHLVFTIGYIIRVFDVNETKLLNSEILPNHKKPKNFLFSYGDWLFFSFGEGNVTKLLAFSYAGNNIIYTIQLKAGIRSAACSPGGTYMLMHTIDGYFGLYDAQTGQSIKDFSAQQTWNVEISNISFTSESEFIGCSGRSVIIGDIESGIQNRLFTHPSKVNQVVATAGGKKVLTTTTVDFVVRVWQPKTHAAMQPQKASFDEDVRNLKLIPGTRRYILILTNKKGATTTCSLKVYDIYTHEVVRAGSLSTDIVYVNVFSENSALLVDRNKKLYRINFVNMTLDVTFQEECGSPNLHLINSNADVVCLSRQRNTIQVMQLSSGELKTVIKTNGEHAFDQFMVSKDGSLSVCLQRINKQLSAFVFSIPTQRVLYQFNLPVGNAMDPAFEIVVSSNNKFLLLKTSKINEIVYIWNLESGELMHELQMGKMLHCYESDGLKFIRYESNMFKIEVYDALTGKPEERFEVDDRFDLADCLPEHDQTQGRVALLWGEKRVCWLYNIDTWSKYACFMPDNVWYNTTMVDRNTIVASNEVWNDGALDNIHVLKLYTDAQTDEEPPILFARKGLQERSTGIFMDTDNLPQNKILETTKS